MKLRTKGKTVNINQPYIVKATRYSHKLVDPIYCLILENNTDIPEKYHSELVITSLQTISENYHGKCVYKIDDFSHICEDDILHIGIDGNIRTMYRVNSNQNALLLTERCNSNCLMCSQPPKDKDDIEFLHNIHLKLIPLIPKNCKELAITGGEPTLLGERFFELLNLIKNELPNTEIHILTNGRIFSVNKFAEKLGIINNPRIMLGIPIYSDYYQTHDYIVQSKAAYHQTMMGIYNLKRYKIRVEIRIVLHKITIPRLFKLSQFIYRNLSFVNHVAFMGLEITGHTIAHLKELWIEPTEYMEQLKKSINYLHNRKLNVSIYNTPLCILPLDLWMFNKKSISDWKNVYFDACENCLLLHDCGGLFSSSRKKYSKHLKAFDVDPRNFKKNEFETESNIV